MKRINMLILVLLSFFLTMGSVTAATIPKATSKTDYSTCIAFSDGFKNIATDYYYKYCYRASCSANVWNKADMTGVNGYRCSNGNGTPYTKVTSDGCSGYTGSCSKNGEGAYCTKVVYVDCDRVAGGGTYVSPNRPTTAQTTTSRTVVTTKTPTTKKTTTKKASTNRTTLAPFTNPTKKPSTTTTTKTTVTTTKAINNTNIKKITVNDTDIKYSKTKDTYSLKLKYDVTEVSVNVELEDETSTYVVTGNTEMPNEDHQIKIVVTAVSGDTKEVTLNVKRYTTESSDCTLANIYSEDYPIDFSKNTYSYKLKLPKNVNNIDLEIVPSDEESATYQVEGNEKLKNNSKITIDVRAQDGTTCKYEITIKKSSNTWKYIVVIVLLLSVLVVASVVLYKYLKKSKGKYKYE